MAAPARRIARLELHARELGRHDRRGREHGGRRHEVRRHHGRHGGHGGHRSTAPGTEITAPTAPPLQPGTLGENEVANVAGSSVTKEEFDHLLEIARAQQTAQGSEAPKAGTAEDDALRRQVMQVLVRTTSSRWRPSARA